MKQYFFHLFTSFEIIGRHKSGPVASVGRRGGGELKCTHSTIPLPFETDTSHRQKLTCRVLKVLIMLFSQAKYNCERFETRSHFKSSLTSLYNQ